MDNREKLRLAYDIVSVYDYVPDNSETSLEEYILYIERFIGVDIEEPTLQEFRDVLLEFVGQDVGDIGYEIRKEYFNS